MTAPAAAPNRRTLRVKRAVDVLSAGGGLVILAPVLALIGAAVKATSPGPALFGHTRVGRGGQQFKTWKFRTMVHGADRLGPSVTSGGDPRVTSVGKLLRKTKLDELPQLFNVLVGEMSLVGPRPEVPRYVEMFRDDYHHILRVRPGITDEASLEFRNEEEILAQSEDAEREYVERVLPRKIELYRQYVDDVSLRRDASILLRTVYKVLAG